MTEQEIKEMVDRINDTLAEYLNSKGYEAIGNPTNSMNFSLKDENVLFIFTSAFKLKNQ